MTATAWSAASCPCCAEAFSTAGTSRWAASAEHRGAQRHAAHGVANLHLLSGRLRDDKGPIARRQPGRDTSSLAGSELQPGDRAARAQHGRRATLPGQRAFKHTLRPLDCLPVAVGRHRSCLVISSDRNVAVGDPDHHPTISLQAVGQLCGWHPGRWG